MEQTHIIHKVVIEVSVNNRKKAYEIKDDISSFLTMTVFPKLEKHLNTVQAQIPAHTLQISRLAVEINPRESSLNTTLKNDIITSFKKELGEIIKKGSGQHLNQRQNQSSNQRYNQQYSKNQRNDQNQDQPEGQHQGYEQSQSDAQGRNDRQNQSPGQNQNQNHGQNQNQNQSHGQIQNQNQAQNQNQNQNQDQDQRPNQGHSQSSRNGQNQRNEQNQHPSQNPRYGQNHDQNPHYGYDHGYDQNQYHDPNQYYDATENPEIHFLGETEKLLLTFIHFIEKGTMPWWNANKTSAAIFESVPFKKIISEKAFAAKIVASLKKPKVRERTVNQFTDAQIAQICLAVIKAKGLKIALKGTEIKQLSGSSFADRKALWFLIFNILTASFPDSDSDDYQKYIIEQAVKTIPYLQLAKSEDTEEQLWDKIMTLFPAIKQRDVNTIRNKNNDTGKKVPKNKENTREKGILEKDSRKVNRNQIDTNTFNTDIQDDNTTDTVNGYQVENAGLVLIHPFIGNLFKNCNLIDPETKKLTDPETGIHLLHYIATGKTNQPESNMLFEKFLCNVPLHQSINRHVKLSRKHKAEAAKVIGAVQQNWSSMTTASVALLQHEFFQRPGKLVIANLTLTVERKTQDILMDKLSWGIGMIRLPWQNEFIFVNW